GRLTGLAGALLASLVVGAETMAQQQPTTAPPASGGAVTPGGAGGAAPAGKAQTVEGKVKSWDAASHMLTLEDGTQISIPADVKVQSDQLKPGAKVKASFEEKAGQKVAKSVEMQ